MEGMIPIIPLVLSVVVASLAGRDGKEESHQREGLSDEELFLLTWGNNDVFVGMTFEEACLRDPRRIDARIQQGILQILNSGLQIRADDAKKKSIARAAWMSRSASLYDDKGKFDVRKLTEGSFEVALATAKVLEAMATAGEKVRPLIASLIEQKNEIRQGLAEAIATAHRADETCPSDGWGLVVQGLTKVDQAVNRLGRPKESMGAVKRPLGSSKALDLLAMAMSGGAS
jgi:hypothetical protein